MLKMPLPAMQYGISACGTGAKMDAIPLGVMALP